MAHGLVTIRGIERGGRPTPRKTMPSERQKQSKRNGSVWAGRCTSAVMWRRWMASLVRPGRSARFALTSMCKALMKPSDLVIVDLEGGRVSGRRDGRSEGHARLGSYRPQSVSADGDVHAERPLRPETRRLPSTMTRSRRLHHAFAHDSEWQETCRSSSRTERLPSIAAT